MLLGPGLRGSGGGVRAEDASVPCSMPQTWGPTPIKPSSAVSGMKAEAGVGGPAVVRGACFPHQTWKEDRLELRVTKRESRNSTPTGGFPTLGSGLGSATFCVTLN